MADFPGPLPAKGKPAEAEARRYLEKKGYRLVAANFRAAGGEIDIIAEKDGVLCFTEVKSRLSDRHGIPEEYVTRRKQERIIRAAKIFSARRKYRGLLLRFDIVAVQHGGGRTEITHLENAFEKEQSCRS